MVTVEANTYIFVTLKSVCSNRLQTEETLAFLRVICKKAKNFKKMERQPGERKK